MGDVATGGALKEVATALGSGLSAGLPDRELVSRFAGGGEGADSTFAVLVHRHGPMVWALCRRVAGDPEDAADAFQATFLVLARRAGSVRVGDSLAPWLRGVALRVARRAWGRALRRRARERTNREAALAESAARSPDGPDPDLRAVLDEELARLPSAYRSALEACYLDGLTHEGAAETLGCPVGTIRSRLARGRDLLRTRLARRGLGGPIDGLLALLLDPTLAPIPPGLLASTARLGRGLDLARPGVVTLATVVARGLVGGRWLRFVGSLAGILLISGAVWASARPAPLPLSPPADDSDAPLPAITAEALAQGVHAAIGRPRVGLLVAEYQEERLESMAELSLLMNNRPEPPPLDDPDPPPPAPDRPPGGEALLPLPPPPVPPLPPPLLADQKKAQTRVDLDAAIQKFAQPRPIVYERGPGRFTYRADARRWRVEHDGLNLRFGRSGEAYPPDQWAAGFDGVVHYETRDRGMTVDLGSTRPEAEAEVPAALFWDGATANPLRLRDAPGSSMDVRVRNGVTSPRLTDSLAPLDTALLPKAEVGQRTVDGYRCYTLAMVDPYLPDSRVEAVVSPRQSMLALSVRKIRRDRVEHSFAASEPRRGPDGEWYPGRIVVEDWIVPYQGNDAATLKSRRDLRVVRCEPIGPEPGPGTSATDLTLAIPPNSKVLDRRLGQGYLNDLWWPEIHRYLTDKQAWPDLDPAPLAALHSPRMDLDGRDAPRLDVEGWLVGEAIDPTLHDQAATLLVFPNPGDPTLAPMLRRLAGADPTRLRVVTVVPRIADHTANTERESLREFRWPGPVAWDGPLRFRYGPTSAAYGVGDFCDLPAAYLVTPEGKVRTITPRGWLAVVNEQLDRQGGRPLAFPAPEAIGVGRRWFALNHAWASWAQAAPHPSRLSGTITDAGGRPVPAAVVHLKLFAEVVNRIDASMTGGWTTQRLTLDEGREATTDAGGRFVVAGLCKGNYAVRVLALGHAATEGVAVVPEGASTVDFRLALPGDSIAGTIHDEAGGPVAGVLVEVFNRHTRAVNGGTTYGLDALFGPKHTATADSAGRYRCGPLPDGLYSVRVTAPGRAEQIRYDVAAGTETADFTLKRTDQPEPSPRAR